MQDVKAEASRIRDAYERRDSANKARLYSWAKADALFIEYRVQAAMARALLSHGWNDLTNKDCLDVGCGTGGWLRRLTEWGATPNRLHGTELLANRVEKARQLSPGLDCRVTEGWPIPFDSRTMDLVSASTVFSSILDGSARAALAAEMRRVLRPGGLILVYDFRISHPRNPDTLGIRSAEVRRLFPGMTISSQSLTLAPPLLRRVAAVSAVLAHAIEAGLPFLRTHALHRITERWSS